jgi:hypothetical protein
MPVRLKRFGHYQGDVEDLTTEEYRKLNPIHKQLYNDYQEKLHLEELLEAINDRIKLAKDSLLEGIQKKELNFDWAWVYEVSAGKPKWKEEFIRTNSTAAAEEVAKRYKGKKIPKVGIKYIDPIPESIVQIKEHPKKIPIRKHNLKK